AARLCREGQASAPCGGQGVASWPSLCELGAQSIGRAGSPGPTGLVGRRWQFRHCRAVERSPATGGDVGANGQEPLFVPHPRPVGTLFFWAWQREELEVAHREVISGFGLGDKQCFNPLAAVASVQWSAWICSVLLLAAYRTWGLTRHPRTTAKWWPGAPRWSF